MPIAVADFDPHAKSTGVNTVLKIVVIPAKTGAVEYDIAHGLGYVPSWARVTPMANAVPGEVRLVTPTGYAAVCQPIVQEGLAGDEPKWDPGAGPGFRNLREVLGFVMANPSQTDNAYFLVEIGRTHSVPK